MNDDWKVGDLALCVMDGCNTKAGQSFTVRVVAGVGLCDEYRSIPRGPQVTLIFREVAHPTNLRGKFTAARFIKITPPKADEFDREVIEQMTSEEVPA